VKLGFLTVPFPDRTLEEIAEYAASNGFAALEVACWPAGAGVERRYAGVCHVDVEALGEDDAPAIVDMLAQRGITISALGYYPNNLDPDPAAREQAHTHLRAVVTAAARLGVSVVTTFVGRDPARNVPDNMAMFREAWPPLVEHAEAHGIKIAIENCPMIFSYDSGPAARTSPTPRRSGERCSKPSRARASASTSTRPTSSGR
jgi:sugar phosphate isomerase/epimerase